MGTIGEKLIEFRHRTGLSLEDVAKGAGYSGRSSIQRYFDPDYDRPLDIGVASKLSVPLSGRGYPPIATTEILALAGPAGLIQATPSDALPLRYHDLPRDVPVYGTAIGTFMDGTENARIEQTTVYKDDPIDFFLRPPGVPKGRAIYGVYIAGSSQSPRFEEGEIAFVDPQRPPMIGDDVVVYLRKPDGEGEGISAVLVKRLIRRSSSYIELHQFNPELQFKIESAHVMQVHRIITNAEMLSYR